MEKIQLSDHFTVGRLLRFTWPSAMMLVITSIYGVVDGLMVSNYVGTEPFAALNLIWPFVAILGAGGCMLGTGGSALVAKFMGMGRNEKAGEVFSMLTVTAVLMAVVLGVVGTLTVRRVAVALGAEGTMVDLCVTYAGILLLMLPALVLQVYFQQLLITAECPRLAMWVTIAAGLTNVVGDFVLIGLMGYGLTGAAWATGISQIIGGVAPLFFFLAKRHSDMRLRFRRPRIDWKALGKTCSNGISEYVMQISLSIVSMLYMYQLLREAGQNGVAAYGIMMYYSFTFLSAFIGFGIGVAPIVSYHYGARNHAELHSLLRLSLRIIAVGGVGMTLLAQVFAGEFSSVFVSYDAELLSYTTRAFRIYSVMFLVAGFNIFASAFFTALNNGPVSALISMMRTIILEAGCVMLLPMIFGIDGIWWSVTVAEGLSLILSFYLLARLRPRYGY